jgi:pimeloyl-ACP methyl ester carboxylesterase
MKRLILGIAVTLISACASLTDPSATRPSVLSTDHRLQVPGAHDGSPVRIYVKEKRAASLDVSTAATTRKVVLLAHGAGTPGSLVFDLQVPAAAQTYSMMDYLAARGFDVFAIDYQNYGLSDRHACGLCVTTDKAALDVDAAVEHIRKLRGVDRVHLVGWSWGANITALYASRHPDKVGRLVMYAPPMWTAQRGDAPKAQFRKVAEQGLRRLLEPSASDPPAVDVLVKGVLESTPEPPNGVLMDLNRRMPLNDPTSITRPTLIVYGELDGQTPVKEPNLPVFFTAMPVMDKQLRIIPGAGHFMVIQKQRLRFYQEVAQWLEATQ